LTNKKIVVLGVGNILLKDEGIGVRVVQAMEKMDLPDGVELIDGGTAGFDLLYPVQEADKLIVVDAIEASSEPGDIFKFTPQDVKLKSKEKVSLHEIEILEVLKMAENLGKCPETVIFGIQPKEIDLGLELTSELQEKIPRVIELVLEEIGKLKSKIKSEDYRIKD